MPTKDQGTTDDGSTPLFIAAQNGHLKSSEFWWGPVPTKDQGTTDEGASLFLIAGQQ